MQWEVEIFFNFILAWRYVRRCAKKEESSDKEILDQTHKTSLKTIVKIDTKSRGEKNLRPRVLKFKKYIYLKLNHTNVTKTENACMYCC